VRDDVLVLARLQRMRRSSLIELVLTVVLALGLALTVQAYAVKPYKIPSGSMEPTLQVGQRVLVNRISHRLGADPHVGDIVVFRPPRDAPAMICGDRSAGAGTARPCDRPGPGLHHDTYIKRVVAVGGDTLAIRNGHAIRNGQLAHEPFVLPCRGESGCNFRQAITVPAGYVFLMGDNRGNSDDSRYWGPLPVARIIGQAFASYWPPSRVGTL
jgi:signal peptidase I